MKKKKEKSEKQLEAARLIDKIVRLKMTEVPVHWKRKMYNGTMLDEESDFELCIVNGNKYIRKNSFGWKGGNFINKMENNGTIKSSDILHYYNLSQDRYQGGKLNVLIKTDILLKLKDEMMECLKNGDWAESSIEESNRVYEAINNTSIAIGEYEIDEEKLKESEAAYFRRIELIRENANEKREKEWREEVEQRKIEREERELERLKLEQSLKPQDETLQELVAKIEAMGWEVTLRMKSQVSVAPANEILDFER